MTTKKNEQRNEQPATSEGAPQAGATRRDFALGTLGGAAVAVLLAACGGDDGSIGDGDGGVPPTGGDPDAAPGTPGDPDATPGTPDATPDPGNGGTFDAGGPGTCTVYPQETEGPFYLDLDLLRSDIKGGQVGVPLKIKVQVVSASACAPLKDVAVDIWHCNHIGQYSGYPGQQGGVDTTGQTWLRGTQVTDANGAVSFDTNYPGWYPGRTTHVHFKVHTSSTREATSQMYFPEDVNTAVYNFGVYAPHGQKDKSNASDQIAHAGGGLPPLLVISGSPQNGYVGTLTITVA